MSKTVYLIGLKILGLMMMYWQTLPNQLFATLILLICSNLWFLRLNFDKSKLLKFTYLIDSFLLFYSGNVFMIGFIVVPEICCEWLRKEQIRSLEIKDAKSLEIQDKEVLIGELMSAQSKIEQLTILAERARISADIHDHAGHDIMGAYLAFQMLEEDISDEYFDEALHRLETGVEKIRIAVHNINPDVVIGIEAFKKIADRFKDPKPNVQIYGDFNQINQVQYNVLEAALKEGLTNIAKHATPTFIDLELTITSTLIHFKLVNDGVHLNQESHGIGMKNLRRRAESVGGTFHTRQEGDQFHLILTILQ